MIYAQIVGAVVVATSVRRPADMTNWLAVDGALPPRPDADDARLVLVDGVLSWQTGPTRSDVEAQRAAAYRDRVDPIMSEISRRMYMGGDEEKLLVAQARLRAAVAAIEAEYPYPEV